ncbi:AAA family ATPase [Embleya scabrispora]|uniref:AAA family ATPase n=1 Tax=Embleya scabrispora TaxID=159449 RepID=UPI0003756726|nr:AAA family ATPase [Embleya scabrispora]MYS87313.1 AAA family ATPase [Streptomyces sp. SID5474]
MDETHGPDRTDAARDPAADSGLPLHPRGLVDLRGRERGPAVLGYPTGAVVVVSGLPGSGKSTLLNRWSRSATVIDPRTAHVEYQARMPRWLPYAVYRPWVRLQHMRRLRAHVRDGGPVLVHDCGSRPWMRRWLARSAGRQRRELHLVLLAVDAADALAGQEKRGRWVPGRVFDRHRRGLAQLLLALSVQGGAVVPEAASVVLLDRTLREHVVALEFGPGRAPRPLPKPLPEPIEPPPIPPTTTTTARVATRREPRTPEPTP